MFDPILREKIGALPEHSVERFLAWVVAAQAGNILIAGEFSSGKTTLLNALCQYFPPNSPLAIMETFREVQPPDELYQMRAVAPSMLLKGQEDVATMDWVLNVVYTRTNPAAILLSEIVSPGEAMQFLMAANLGRRAYSTIHGGTVNASLRRLEKFALQELSEVGREVVRELITGGVNLVVHLSRYPQEKTVYRFISEVALIIGINDDGIYQMDTLYCGWEGTGVNAVQLIKTGLECAMTLFYIGLTLVCALGVFLLAQQGLEFVTDLVGGLFGLIQRRLRPYALKQFEENSASSRHHSGRCTCRFEEPECQYPCRAAPMAAVLDRSESSGGTVAGR